MSQTSKSMADRAEAPIVVPLGQGRSVRIQPQSDAATLQIRGGGGPTQTLDIEIRFSTEGPEVRVRAQTLALEAVEHVSAQCASFSVHARERIELKSEGSIVQEAAEEARVDGRRVALNASPGAVRITANDEVQLLGEMILLNCDRPKPLPSWAAQRVMAPPPTLPLTDENGDAEVLEALRKRS